jgi:hypothetical protein
MIGSLRSMCMTCRHLVEGLGVASDTGHLGPTKGRVEAGKSYLCLGDTSTLFPHSFYLLYRSRS